MLRMEENGPVVKILSARSFLGRVAYRAAAYWVDGLLIDSGCAFTAAELSTALSSFRLHQVVNTHSHEDHIGANGLLQRSRGIEIWAHSLALPILANPKLQPLQLYRRLFWGWPAPSQGQSLGQWVETEHHRFQVLHTPGHSVDHICLYEPQHGWLFSGDAFIGGKDRAARPDYDIYSMIESLRTLADLPLKRLFPGSGTVRDNPANALRCKVRHLEDLGEQVLRLHHKGYSVPAIRSRVLGSEPHLTYLTLGHFRGRYLVESYLRGR